MQLPDLQEPRHDTEERLEWVRAVVDSLDVHAARFGLSPDEASKVLLVVATAAARARGLSEPLVQQTVDQAMSHFRDMVH